jgi:hypothetical protein
VEQELPLGTSIRLEIGETRFEGTILLLQLPGINFRD